jgi:hypothetical protein
MTNPHPNVAKMTATVQGWIAAAQGRDDGAALLRKRAAWVESQLQLLGSKTDAPEHLRGLTAVDLTLAMMDLRAAAQAHRVAA